MVQCVSVSVGQCVNMSMGQWVSGDGAMLLPQCTEFAAALSEARKINIIYCNFVETSVGWHRYLFEIRNMQYKVNENISKRIRLKTKCVVVSKRFYLLIYLFFSNG